MTAGMKIYELRTALNLTQERLGEIVGASRQTLSKWELDLAFPEPAKLKKLCKALGISADDLLSYLDASEPYSNGCGVYRDDNREIVLTSKYALEYYSENSKLGTRLFSGDEKHKYLFAECEHDTVSGKTSYAYKTDRGEIISESGELSAKLGIPFEMSRIISMKLIEPMYMDQSSAEMPYVGEKSVSECLSAWRNRSALNANGEYFSFTLCTRKLEYVFSITRQDNDIYCGASNNQMFDMGLIGGRQYFRLRSYKDDSAPFCAFFCDFSWIPTELTLSECAVSTSDAVRSRVTCGNNIGCSNLVFFIKRFKKDEIVLAGCGGDEYYYHRDDPYSEIILS